MPRQLLRLLALCLPTFCVSISLLGQQAPSSRRLDRLQSLAELDGALNYFHPVVAVQPSRWDSLFADFAPRIADAPTSDAYAIMLRELIAQLGDPATRVVARGGVWMAERLPTGAVLARSAPLPDRNASFERETAQARTLVVDLRRRNADLPEDYLARLILPRSAAAAAQRNLRYGGLPRPERNDRRDYYRAWHTRAGEHFEGGEGRRAAFLVDSQSILPPLVLALRSTGRGAVIGIGTARVRAAAESYRVRMGEGVSIDVRVGQRMIDTVDAGLAVDTTVLDSAAAVAAAIRWANRSVRPWSEVTQDTVGVVAVPLAPTTGPWSASYPARGYRLLAAARLWNTMRFFFPYKAEMGDDWDAAFRAALPTIENAPDSLAFVKGIAAFATHLHDSHVRVWNSRVLSRDFFGEAQVPAVVQFIEGQLVVIRIVDTTASRAGLAVGDVITSIDGEATTARVARLSAFIMASTPQALRARLAGLILAGRDSTAARLTILPARGPERTVRIPRSPAYQPPLRPYGLVNRDGPVVSLLPGNIAYVDLERVTDSIVDTSLTMLRQTKGIVFDARGYPTSEAANRFYLMLSRPPDSIQIAREELPVVVSPDTARISFQASTQIFAPKEGLRYGGRAALVIDERAISWMENLGLWFEQSGVLLVGSPTTGADGAITFVQLPGGFRISFSGAGVRHANGRPLQRVGLQPDIPVSPTIAGVRSGRDEVLERAVSCLASDLCSGRNAH